MMRSELNSGNPQRSVVVRAGLPDSEYQIKVLENSRHIMTVTKKIIKAAAKPIIQYRAHQQLGLLSRAGDSAAELVAAAIGEAMEDDLSPDERQLSNDIETLRSRLAESTEQLPYVDFGAGDAGDERSAEQMSTGVTRQMTVGQACRASKGYFWSLLLFKLVRKFQPMTCIELGTCLGISAAYQAGAQKLNGKGRLVTLEGAPALAELAQSNLESFCLDNAEVITGRFADTLHSSLRSYNPIDYAFVDGHHDELATLGYFEQLLPFIHGNAVVVFDDISWSAGMRRAWQQIEGDENVAISVDLRTVGICIVRTGHNAQKYRFDIRMPV